MATRNPIAISVNFAVIGRTVGSVAFPWAMFLYSSQRIFFPIQQLLYVVFFFVLVFFALVSLLAVRNRDIIRFLSALGPILALYIWSGFSLLWSVDPARSLQSFRDITMITAYGIMFSFYYSIEEQLRLLALGMSAVALVSLLRILFMPSLAIMSEFHPGAWTGIFWHKNLLGIHIALGVVVFTLCAFEDTRYRLLSLAGVAVCLVLLIGSRSVTGFASAFAGLITYTVVKSLRAPLLGLKRKHLALTWLAAVLITGVCLASNFEAALKLIGRDTTLTKRTLIWSLMLEKGAERPWLGYGLNSFWNGNTGVSAEVIETLGFNPYHSHNGMMDLYIELGLIGIMIFSICFLMLCIPAYREAVYSPRAADCWGLVFLAALITINLPESLLYRYNCIFWMLFVTTLCNLLGKTKILPSSSI